MRSLTSGTNESCRQMLRTLERKKDRRNALTEFCSLHRHGQLTIATTLLEACYMIARNLCRSNHSWGYKRSRCNWFRLASSRPTWCAYCCEPAWSAKQSSDSSTPQQVHAPRKGCQFWGEDWSLTIIPDLCSPKSLRNVEQRALHFHRQSFQPAIARQLRSWAKTQEKVPRPSKIVMTLFRRLEGMNCAPSHAQHTFLLKSQSLLHFLHESCNLCFLLLLCTFWVRTLNCAGPNSIDCLLLQLLSQLVAHQIMQALKRSFWSTNLVLSKLAICSL